MTMVDILLRNTFASGELIKDNPRVVPGLFKSSYFLIVVVIVGGSGGC